MTATLQVLLSFILPNIPVNHKYSQQCGGFLYNPKNTSPHTDNDKRLHFIHEFFPKKKARTNRKQTLEWFICGKNGSQPRSRPNQQDFAKQLVSCMCIQHSADRVLLGILPR